MLKVKLQNSAKYSHFRILLKAAERLGIFSIPVRVTIQRSRKQRKYAVSEFFFYSENPLCSLSVLYFENAESGAMGQAPFGSFFLPEKSSAELTASETFALDSSNI